MIRGTMIFIGASMLGALGAAPWLAGRMTEAPLLAELDRNAAELKPFGTLTTVRFERGWLRTDAAYRFILRDREKTAIEITQRIVHGPVLLGNAEKFGLAAIETEVLWPVGVAERLRAIGADAAALVASTLVGFTGESITRVNSKSFAGQLTGGAGRAEGASIEVAWGGLSGEITSTANRATTYDLQGPKLLVRLPMLEASASRMALTGEVTPSSIKGLSNGHLRLRLAEIQSAMMGAKASLRGIELAARQSETGTAFGAGYSIAIDSIVRETGSLDRAGVPTGIPTKADAAGGSDGALLTKLRFEIEADGVDKRIVAQYYDALGEFAQPKVTPGLAQVQAMEFVSKLARELLASGFTVRLKEFSAETAEGRFALNAALTVPAGTPPPESAIGILESATVNAKATGPTKLVREHLRTRGLLERAARAAGIDASSPKDADPPKDPATDPAWEPADLENADDQPAKPAADPLEQLLAMGLVVQSGANVGFELTLERGKAHLNGKRLPLPVMGAN